MPSTPLYLVTGFLGSGKTTFLKHVIDYFEGKQKIAIIQNEFAPASFDGQELKRTTHNKFDLLEVNNGSVFCVCLLSGFIDSLQSFVSEYQPEIIFMESSGLSDPVSIGQIFNSSLLKGKIHLAGTICIVDANNFNKFDKLIPRIHHQLQIADLILINKTDLTVNPDNTKEIISKINPFAGIYLTQHCDLPLEEVFSTSIHKQKKKFFVPGNSDRPDINAFVFRSNKPLKQEYLNDFIIQLTQKAIRTKGYIKLDNEKIVSIQTVSDEINLSDINSAVNQTEMIIMGNDLENSFIEYLYKSLSFNSL